MIEGFKKLKINIRNEYGHTAVKVTAKPMPTSMSSETEDLPETDTASPAEQDIDTKPNYKNLKKRMKASFKVIFKSVHAGTLPRLRWWKSLWQIHAPWSVLKATEMNTMTSSLPPAKNFSKPAMIQTCRLRTMPVTRSTASPPTAILGTNKRTT